jgi:exopolyphosphatase/pppGpp-phosphohydrolase
MHTTPPTSNAEQTFNDTALDLTAAVNVLRTNERPNRIAVLELSSRACKLLLVNVALATNGFNWSAFDNVSTLTHTSLLLDDDNVLDWNRFEERVLPTLQRYLDIIDTTEASVLYCVATACLRAATNQDAILQRIQDTLGLRIQVLSQREEALATMRAYRWSLGNRPQSSTLLVEQGGGSTELVAFGPNFTPLTLSAPCHIQVGSTTAIQGLLNGKGPDENFGSYLRDEAQNIGFQVQQATQPLMSQKIETLIGVGSALTDITGKDSNKQQHLSVLTRDFLQQKHDQAFHALSSHPDFSTVSEFRNRYHHPTHPNEQRRFNQSLVRYFGLGMLLQIMRKLNFQSITVNGVGLRYGICHNALHTLRLLTAYPSNDANHTVKSQRRLGSLSEGKVVTGTISNIDDRFGIFVVLNNAHTGLLHKNNFLPHHPPMNTWSTGDSVEVRIHKIKFGKHPRFVLRLL